MLAHAHMTKDALADELRFSGRAGEKGYASPEMWEPPKYVPQCLKKVKLYLCPTKT